MKDRISIQLLQKRYTGKVIRKLPANKCVHVLFICLLAVLNSYAQVYNPGKIYLKDQVIVTRPDVDDWITRVKAIPQKLPLNVLIQFDTMPSPETRKLLSSKGIELGNYVPEKAFSAIVYHTRDAHLLKELGAVSVIEVNYRWKISKILDAALRGTDGYVEVSVSFAKYIPGDAVEALIAELGADMIDNRLHVMGYCNVRIPVKNIARLAQWYGTTYLTSYLEDQALNKDAKALTRIEMAATPPALGGYGLKGEGVIVGVGDNSSGIFHTDLKDRIINFNPFGYTNHGVHINGIVGGAGIVNPEGEGMAPAALLTNHFFSQVLDATPQLFDIYGVQVTNNSYSASLGDCDYAGTYDVISQGLDKLCLAYPKVLQVFAAGNDGHFDCPPFPTGFATVAGGYQVAKNNIVVTSTDKEYNNAWNASKGPVKDGRLKPEITAVGFNVFSTTKEDEYLVASGTSMACPQVAGAAALLTQRYRQLKGGQYPEADLLKTLLINGASDIGIPGPDFRFGFGFLNMERTLMMLDSNRYFTGISGNGAQQVTTINVPPGVAQLKVLLCWHDPEANLMSARQLVNDLDIEVRTPANKIHKPLIPDPAPANINKPAAEGEDRLNNCEQVVIDAPLAGSYDIITRGFNVPGGQQPYVVAYDFIPPGISVKYPLAGSKVRAGDTAYIYWDATPGSNNFTLEYSVNDGNTWLNIDNDVPADRRWYRWAVPLNINSGMCRVRLTRKGTAEQSVSGKFIINFQPEVRLAATQCPGYIHIEWDTIPSATAYGILRKAGAEVVAIDTVLAPGTSYIFKGLASDSIYYVMVQPIIDGVSGYRSIAFKRQPNDGDCSGSISNGDMGIVKVSSPVTGRRFTAGALTAFETLSVVVRNLDDVPVNSYRIHYRVNNSPWQTSNIIKTVPANSTDVAEVTGIDLSAIGDYTIDVAVENLSMQDSVVGNDSFTVYVAHLPNDPVVLDFTDGFETMGPFSVTRDTAGLGDGRRWDYSRSTDTGRLSSFILNSTLISGGRSISMDAYKSNPGNINLLTGTFNLSGYDATKDEVRLEFDYIIHGVPQKDTANEVWARGSDTRDFRTLYGYTLTNTAVGRRTNSGTLSLSDIMLAAGDNFSSSTQIRFGQNDTSVIAARNFGNGITLDNIRLYTVQNDVQLLSVETPGASNCGISGAVPLVVKVRNGVAQEQTNVAIFYRLDNGQVVSEIIPSIRGKETIGYTFTNRLDISAYGRHILDVWLVASGDTYVKNDSIMGYEVRNQPLITSYPYVEDFEDGDGYWFADGINNSWEYGSPSGAVISNAAGGQRAWVTDLDGAYNDNERSFLYSPCFDLTGMQRPELSFRMAVDIENCGEILCDAAYVEYTTDGNVWQKLGGFREGTNWYNDSNYGVWNEENIGMWRQASITLPTGVGNLQLRYVLVTDVGTSREGIGVDDVRIADNPLHPADNNIISISPNPVSDGNITIGWTAAVGTPFNMAMTDVTGREVFKFSTTAPAEGYNKMQIQTPAFSSGLYLMRIVIGEREHSRKIVYTRR